MEITAKEILEKNLELGLSQLNWKQKVDVLAAMKEIAKEAFDAGKERGIHLGKCEMEGIHPDGRPGVPQRRHQFLTSLFPESK
jgi:hypothetical protein